MTISQVNKKDWLTTIKLCITKSILITLICHVQLGLVTHRLSWVYSSHERTHTHTSGLKLGQDH